MLLDQAGEAKLGKLQIGTTRRGIGPCYADKAARLGIRVQDLLDEKILKKKIVAALEPKRLSLRPFPKDPQLDLQTITEEYLTYGHRLEPYIADTVRLVRERLDAGQTVVFEGAQGALLDIDHGTYPFVTSSNPVAGAACVGAGVGPKDIDEVLGRDARRTAPAWAPGRSRPSSTATWPRRSASAAGSSAPLPAGQTGRLDRSGGPALRRAHQLADRAGRDQARRALRHRAAVRVHALPRPRGLRVRLLPLPPDGPAPRSRRIHHDARLDRGPDRLPRGVRPARRPPATTCSSSPSSSAFRSRSSGLVPGATRSSGRRPGSGWRCRVAPRPQPPDAPNRPVKRSKAAQSRAAW